MWGCGPEYASHWSGLTLVIVVVAAAALLLCLLRALPLRGDSRCSVADKEDSLLILKIRLARGEISHEDYRRMKKILEE